MNDPQKITYSQKASLLKNYELTGNEKLVENTLTNLKFISKIEKYEKVNVSNKTISKNDYQDRLYRTLIIRENKDDTMDFLRDTINDGISLAVHFSEMDTEFYKNISKIIIKHLSESKKGIESLCETYSTDRLFVSKLNTLIETLNIKGKELLS
jgi:hypothetical protein